MDIMCFNDRYISPGAAVVGSFLMLFVLKVN